MKGSAREKMPNAKPLVLEVRNVLYLGVRFQRIDELAPQDLVIRRKDNGQKLSEITEPIALLGLPRILSFRVTIDDTLRWSSMQTR
jgi:hypothetical protein